MVILTLLHPCSFFFLHVNMVMHDVVIMLNGAGYKVDEGIFKEFNICISV